MFGFLNIYKPEGITSHDVVARLRKITKIKQIGHTGTLDPFAEGVLPVCIGKSTRLIEYLNDDKEYIATVQFGKNTSTYDKEGEVVFQSDLTVNSQQIKNALTEFLGEIFQTPPIYSAIKIQGKKLYEYAREGKTVDIQQRKVFISNIELLDFDEKQQSAKILVACSKGTYIRSIAYDLGKILGCGAYLTKLIRTKAGLFDIKQSTKLEDIQTFSDAEALLINPLKMLDLPTLNISQEELEKVAHGQSFYNNSVSCNDFILLIYNNKIKATANVENGIIKVKKVFL